MHHEIIGRSRYGKSTYLENLILAAPGGFAFLDPHGQSAERIADILPDVIYWDAGDTEHVIGYNPLANVPQGQRHLVAAQMVYALKAIWRDSWGPRLEWILYNELYLLLDNAGSSVLDIPRLLTDMSFRKRRLKALERSVFEDPTDLSRGSRLRNCVCPWRPYCLLNTMNEENRKRLRQLAGSKGGLARAKRLPPERRRQIARLGYLARQRKAHQQREP